MCKITFQEMEFEVIYFQHLRLASLLTFSAESLMERDEWK